MVTNGRSVRSRSGSRGSAAARAAASSTSGGKSGRHLAAPPGSPRSPSRRLSRPRRRRRRRGRGPLGSPCGHPSTAPPQALRSVCPVLILLPPERGQDRPAPRQAAGPRGTLAFPALTATRERVLDALVDLCSGDADRAAARPRDLGPTQRDLVERNAGLRDCADGARRPGLHRRPLRRARPRLALPRRQAPGRHPGRGHVSSLFGLVRPGDRIPAYRLSGDATLPGLGTGRRRLARAASARRSADASAAGCWSTSGPATYAAFWRPPPDLARRVATVRVLHEADGTRTGGQPLQQGHQGPDRARAARGRRATPAPRPRSPTCCATSAGRSRRASPAAGHPARRGGRRGLRLRRPTSGRPPANTSSPGGRALYSRIDARGSSPSGPPAKNDSTVTEAGLSSIRNTDFSGASRRGRPGS